MAKAPTIQDKITLWGKELFKLKAKKSKLEDDLTAVNKAIQELATGDLAQLMTDSEIEKITIKGKGTVYISDELYASVKKDDRPKLYEWLRGKGHGALIQDYVFPQTLTAFAKEQLGKGEALPDVMTAAYVPTAKTRAAGKKA